MLLRLLSSLLVALAMLVAPVAMAGGAMAMAPAAAVAADHAGHCDEGVPSDDRKVAHMSCASSCAAMPAVQPQLADFDAPAPVTPPAPLKHDLGGIAPEAETPPPRILPEKQA